MNAQDGSRWGDDAVDEPITVLLVGSDDAVRAALEAAFDEELPVTVRTVPDAAAISAQGEDVDCIVCANPEPITSTCSCLHVLEDEGLDVPFITFAPIDEVGTIREALAAGVTDVVPSGGENAIDVLANRVSRAVESARARVRANAQATELRAERDRFAALFENIPEPTVFYEMKGQDPVTIDVNPAFESVFGYDADVVRGAVVDDFIVPEEKAAEAAELNDRIADGEHLDTEVTRLTAEGRRDFLLRDVPLEEDDTMRGYAIYTDITPQLEREARLRETKTRLEEQNERLEAFTGVVSHDLRNPLSVATTYTELLQERYDDEELNTVRQALDRMDDLIQDLLTLAQQGTEARDLRLLEIELVAREAWDAVDTANASLSLETNGAAVRGDESRLRQLFENLFANSIEHGSTQPGSEGSESQADSVDGDGVSVTVTVFDESDRRGFAVADDGPGIPEAERDRVFEQGFTGGNGTGFGLAIVEAVVDAHDWDVTVGESESGGARFDVTDVDLVQ